MTPHLWASWACWWKWEEGENIGLKVNIQNTKIIASSPITSWQIDGETVETVQSLCIFKNTMCFHYSIIIIHFT